MGEYYFDVYEKTEDKLVKILKQFDFGGVAGHASKILQTAIIGPDGEEINTNEALRLLNESKANTSDITVRFYDGKLQYFDGENWNDIKIMQSPEPDPEIPISLADATWTQIAEISAAGLAPIYWEIGDEKDIMLQTGESLTLQIYAFNHDDLTSGGLAGITFGMKNLMADTRPMNSGNTNVGGFTGSDIPPWFTITLYNLLPADLRSVTKFVNNKTSEGNQSSTINTNSMKLFLFSEVEVFGTTTYSVAGEGSQYPVFTDNANRIKCLSNGSGNKYSWWERSPSTGKSTYFCRVNSDGSVYNGSSIGDYGICFGFCI